jgi:hypothetical protein
LEKLLAEKPSGAPGVELAWEEYGVVLQKELEIILSRANGKSF